MNAFSIFNEKSIGSFVLKASLMSISLLGITHAQANTNIKDTFSSLIQPKGNQSFKSVSLADLSKDQFVSPLDPIQDQTFNGDMTSMGAVITGLKQHPKIGSILAELSTQNDYLRVAQSAYYPQVSSEFATGDFSSNNRGRQVYTISANQMVYDFGKTKATVNSQEAKLIQAQAGVLKAIDDLSFEIMKAVINVIRYEELQNIANLQVKGIERIREIAKLRVDAGISSQADYVQATSRLQSAQSTALMQSSLLTQWRDQLGVLLGGNVSNVKLSIPDLIIAQSNLYDPPDYKVVPQVIIANGKILQTSAEKKSIALSQYPTLSVVGSLSQAVNGINPNSGKDDGTDSSIMLKATSNMYQGGAVGARKNALASAELGAKADLQAIYLDINTQVRNIREVVNQSQSKILILDEHAKSSRMTKELYQEQYKLGKRSILDLLSAEQELYSALMERETTRSDVYQQIAQFINVTGRSRDVYGLNGHDIQGFKVEK